MSFVIWVDMLWLFVQGVGGLFVVVVVFLVLFCGFVGVGGFGLFLVGLYCEVCCVDFDLVFVWVLNVGWVWIVLSLVCVMVLRGLFWMGLVVFSLRGLWVWWFVGLVVSYGCYFITRCCWCLFVGGCLFLIIDLRLLVGCLLGGVALCGFDCLVFFVVGL